MLRLILLAVLLLLNFITYAQGLHTQGKKIVNQNGEEVLLRGMGLGGWMLQEGYMMQSSDVADTQHEFRERLIALMGVANTDAFYDAWLENHVTKADIDSLAAWGFNSVRLPMHYNLFTLPIEEEPVAGQQTWLNKGFQMVDELLQWCEVNQIYLILDLHAAPGGQGANAAISDYDPDKPSLWESEANRAKTVALWQKLAERYKDEPWIGGYDLLNEVNWELPGNTMLRTLYEEITQAIRSVDTQHIIFIEGNWFANDFTGLTPPWDDNMVYSFHKYWNYNDQASVDWIIAQRDAHNIPLWMGEGGENSNVWFTDAIRLLEANDIGWSWWPMKRIETIVGPYSIPFTQGYKDILAWWRGEGPKPSSAEAFASMMELANNTNSAKCLYQKDVPDAMTRQVATTETIPYADQQIPGLVYMSDYDLGSEGYAYHDNDVANYALSTNEFSPWNSGWVYRNDGVDIQANSDGMNSNGYHIGFTGKGEWINYTVQVNEAGAYRLRVRYATSSGGGKYYFSMDGSPVTQVQTATSTGGWETFQTHVINGILLEAGTHTLTFHMEKEPSFNISSVMFEKTGTANEVDLIALRSTTGADERSVEIHLNQALQAASLAGALQNFSLKANGASLGIQEVFLKEGTDRVIVLVTERYLDESDVLKVSYQGTEVVTSSGKPLQEFTEMEVFNALKYRADLPGRIEAEDALGLVGFTTETTEDVDGELNLGYSDPGDYADYQIRAAEAGLYSVKLRVASQGQAGHLRFKLMHPDGTSSVLGETELPVTGGWQIWQTHQGPDLDIPEGNQTLRMEVVSGGFNLNWLALEYPDSDGDGIIDKHDQCANTPEGDEVNAMGCSVAPIPRNNFAILVSDESCPGSSNGKILIEVQEVHNYLAELSGPVNTSLNFTDQTSFDGLPPGTYTVCFTIDDRPFFEQCYTLVVDGPTPLDVIAMVEKDFAQVTLQLKGGERYYVSLNGKTITTQKSELTLPLGAGVNSLMVTTDLECQGSFSEIIMLGEAVQPYPNPVQNNVIHVPLPLSEQEYCRAAVYALDGRLLGVREYRVTGGRISVDVSAIPNGLFILQTEYNGIIQQFKIVK